MVKPLPDALRRHQTARREESRLRLLEAAAETFIAQGYAGTSVARVAAAAGTSPATVYNAFGTKEALFRAMVERELETARSPFLDGVPEFKTGRAALEFVAERHRTAFGNPRIRGLTRLAFAEGPQLPGLSDLFRLPDGRDPTQALGELVLAGWVAQGHFEIEDVGFAVRQFLGALNQAFVYEPMATGCEIADPQGYAASCVDLFMARYGPHNAKG